MADAGSLPSYDSAQAAQRAGKELKTSFEALKSEHNDIQELFKTVKGQLQNTPELGDHHPLVQKWDELRSVRPLFYRGGCMISTSRMA